MKFRVLGELDAEHNGANVNLGGPRQRAVLASLLFRAGQLVSLGYLAEAVWPSPPTTPESTLRTYIANLRARFGQVEDEPYRLITSNGGYRIDTAQDEVDLTRFRALIDEGKRAREQHDNHEAAAAFEKALALWRAHPLSGINPGPALEAEIAYWNELHIDAANCYAQSLLRVGRHAEALATLRRLAVAHPLRESLTEGLMLAHYHSGQQAEAVRAFTEMRLRLADELGVDPSPQLRTLHQRILQGDRPLDPPHPCSDTTAPC